MGIYEFFLSPNFAVLMTVVSAILALVSGYFGKKHSKVKTIADTLIKVIEIANIFAPKLNKYINSTYRAKVTDINNSKNT